MYNRLAMIQYMYMYMCVCICMYVCVYMYILYIHYTRKYIYIAVFFPTNMSKIKNDRLAKKINTVY